jgi:dipeptidyl aminopeptidase/acylaminoacyl peptidase
MMVRTLLVVAALVATQPHTALAQYFGSNKVQYDLQRFQVLKTEHFDIYFHQENREPIDIAARIAERWWARLAVFFGHEPRHRQPLVLYESHIAFEQTQVVPDRIDPHVGGLTEPWRRRIVMPLAASLAETDHVLGHELVHAFQIDIWKRRSRASTRPDTELPLWFVEGLAEFLSIGPVDAHTAMWLRDAVLRDRLPSLSDLPSYSPYRWGHAFWAFVADRWGQRNAAELFRVASITSVRTAIERVLGVKADTFSADWRDSIRLRYRDHVEKATPGRSLASSVAFVPQTNATPALSADGRWMAFLSDRTFLSVDLFVADATTGDVVRRLTDVTTNPRYGSMAFTGSAGSWSRDGRLAFGTLTSGRAAISLFTWPDGAHQSDIVIPEVDEVHSLTWSSDGRMVAFSAVAAGMTDLYVYDLELASLRRLTRDVFADLQPAWEPNGRRVAFVTDRFTSDVATLAFGAFQLAILDVDSGDVQVVPAFPRGKHVSPQWSPDARWLYFVSDSDGTSDLYRIAVRGGHVERLTETPTGVSGITSSSPALSVAAIDGAVAFSVFQNAGFAIQAIEAASGTPVDVPRAPPAAELTEGTALDEPDGHEPPAPLPAPDTTSVSRYGRRLTYVDVYDASLGVGIGTEGPTAASSVGLRFTDVLQTHSLLLAFQLSQGLAARDSAFYGAYTTQVRRWNWKLLAGSTPSYIGPAIGVIHPFMGLLFGPLELTRQTRRMGATTMAYSFDQARRIEVYGAINELTFERIRRGLDGTYIRATAANPLVLGEAAVALVRDTTSAGPTSVLQGERYRFELSPTFGTIRYLRVLADYRRYVMPVPFITIVGRAFHAARYGSGSDDHRVAPFYVGSPGLMRGYSLSPGATSECVAPLSNGCPDVDHLLGSRVAVGSLEARMPVLRTFGLSRLMYGPAPTEVAFFVDGGAAWTSGDNPSGRAWSAGITIRSGFLGAGRGQIDIAYPFQTPKRGWVLEFNFAPPL